MIKLFNKFIQYLYLKQSNNLAIYDQLTGLYNYNWLQLIGKKKYEKEQIYVIMIDLNKFKQINDEKGHAYGNMKLVQVAERLKQIKALDKEADIVRFGGDEFIIFTTENLINLFEQDEESAKISYGIYYKLYNESISEALSEADKKMYQNKNDKHKQKTL